MNKEEVKEKSVYLIARVAPEIKEYIRQRAFDERVTQQEIINKALVKDYINWKKTYGK